MLDSEDEPTDQELKSHYMYMAKIQEVILDVDEDTGPIYDNESLENVHKSNEYIVFANERQHTDQYESINDTYVVKKVDSNITPDSLYISNYGGEVDQDDAQEDEHALLASLIENMKLKIDESKNIQ
nr:hypothetical protein [Tanacetum cinerariifolium]